MTPIDASLPVVATHPDITGTWRIAEGRAQGGASYTGTLAFSVHGAAIDLEWDVSGTAYTGVGLQRGNRLYAGWGTGDEPRVMVYRMEPNGALRGEWTTRKDTTLGVENTAGSTTGTAVPVSGTTPGGARYGGILTLTSDADVFTLAWDIGPQHYVGSGLADGEQLGVGFAASDIGYVEYVFEGNTAKGRWTWSGSPGIYVENLERDNRSAE